MLKRGSPAWSEQQDLNLRRTTDSAQGDSDKGLYSPVAARSTGPRDSDIRGPAQPARIERAGAVDLRGARRAVIYDAGRAPDGKVAVLNWDFVHARDRGIAEDLTEAEAADVIRQIAWRNAR